ncbi:hypothetical protein F4860DRAFT_515976 [Xylaria cubensis]|nr:hypothetical protein F4860DRAFT_515976 [Xylaria cubensis]
MASPFSPQVLIGALQLAIAMFQFIVTIFACLGARRFQLHVVQGNNDEGRPLKELRPPTTVREPA